MWVLAISIFVNCKKKKINMKITFLGHASLQIEVVGKAIIVDPFITANELAKHIDVSTIKADYILITHAHQDHILDVEVIAKNTNAKIVSNYEIVAHYGNKGYSLHFSLKNQLVFEALRGLSNNHHLQSKQYNYP